MNIKLVQQTPNPVDTICEIASICYGSKEIKDKKGFIKKLYLNGHHSVFEHIYFTFKISGVSRVLTHQLIRHRMCSFTQRSQRYCDETENGMILPDSLYGDADIGEISYNTVNLYNKLIEVEGKKKEDARYILPSAMETELYMSCNLRELIHICNERLCSRAQKEIRDMTKEIVKLVDEDLRFMLVPKCQSGFLICNNPCNKKKEIDDGE